MSVFFVNLAKNGVVLCRNPAQVEIYSRIMKRRFNGSHVTTVTDRHYTIHNRGKSYNTRLFQSDCDENYRRSSLVLADENGGDSYLRLFVIVAASDILNAI